MVQATVIVDYQNIHLTGHEMFCPSSEARHLCLVHPLFFAHQVLKQRNLIKRLLAERAGETFAPADLREVVSFRGQPSNRRESTQYARTQAQRSEWTRDKRCRVQYRPLKYYADGTVQEKGIDVMIALEVATSAAQHGDQDVIILACHDTDQEPSLELAHRLAGDHVETAGWAGAKVLKVRGHALWHTKLDGDAFERCRDPRTY